MGIYNPMDGSRDGDISSLQRQRGRREHTAIPARNLSTEEMLALITIPERSDPPSSTDILRAPTPRNVRYDIDAAHNVCLIQEPSQSTWSRRVAQDCRALNRNMLRQFREDQDRDQSNAANAEPDAIHLITPMDVECLVHVVTELFGEEEANYMCTKVIGIPVRHRKNGKTKYTADRNPLIDWSTMCYPVKRAANPRALHDSLMKHVESRYTNPPTPNVPDATVTELEQDERTSIEDRAMEMNPDLPRHVITAEARGIVGYTALRPMDIVSRQHLDAVTRAKQRGGIVGENSASPYLLATGFQRYIEQSGAWLKTNWFDHRRNSGLCTESQYI